MSAPSEDGARVSSLSSDGADARLQRRWLLAARVGWIVVTLLVLSLNLAMIPRYDALLQATCRPGPTCFGLLATAYDRQLLHQLGLSLGLVAAYRVMLDAGSVLFSCALAALIFWRKSTDRMALFCAFMLVLFGGAGYTSILQDTLAPTSLAWFVGIGILYLLGQASFLIFFFLFPSGRFVPGWTRWVAALVLLFWTYLTFFTQLWDTDGAATGLLDLGLSVLVLCAVVAQIHRYRRVSTPSERQQTKWVVFGFAVAMVGFALFNVSRFLFVPSILLQSNLAKTLIAGTAVYSLLLLIPLSITIAILRSRLYDIDTIINLTLVYGLLTGTLGALYAGLILSLEGVLGLFTRQSTPNPVVLVLSTLAIFALFLPVRRRIQTLIDRRFYRRKYNAETTLTAFGAALRNEVKLEQVRQDLLAAVQETMQPIHVSLWLRQPGMRDQTRARESQLPSGEGAEP